MVLIGQGVAQDRDEAVLAKVVKSRNSVRLAHDYEDLEKTRSRLVTYAQTFQDCQKIFFKLNFNS